MKHCWRVWGMMSLMLLLVANMAQAGDSISMSVPQHSSEIILLPQNFHHVVIQDRDIAGAVRHSGRKVSIVGNEVGNTHMRFMNNNGRIVRQVNVTVLPDIIGLKQAYKQFFPHESIGVSMVNNSIAIVGGVTDAQTATRAVAIASQYVGDAEILNMMQIRTGQQVMLRVRVGEIQRTALKKIGVSLQGARTTSDTTVPFATGGGVGNAFGSVTAGADSFGVAGVFFDSDDLDLAATLDLLEEDGLFKVLAEPNLVAISGESAEFFAGGEFPVPTPQYTNVISTEFKRFGVQVGFTPSVIAQNRIRLQVEPEVSELSDAGAISQAGYNIPSISTRKARTTIELAPGESFMIAGLIKDELATKINEIPGLADIPVLSSLFRSTAFQRNETELVIAVTPYLVDPMRNSDVRFPTDAFRAPTVLETVFLGKLGEMTHGNKEGLEGSVGYLVD